MNRPPVGWITVFGLGHMWPASGTWGSLPPVVLAGLVLLGIEQACHEPPGAWGAWGWLYRGLMLGVLVVFSLACIAQGDGAEARFGKKDPSQAVADETAGQCLPLMVLPVAYGSYGNMAAALLTAFLAFRVMDIIKPPPARGLQRVVGGWGILIDDLLAGVYAAVITAAVVRWVL